MNNPILLAMLAPVGKKRWLGKRLGMDAKRKTQQALAHAGQGFATVADRANLHAALANLAVRSA